MSDTAASPSPSPHSGSFDDETPEVGVVRSFLRALEDLDIERALDLASTDVVYQNVPLPPARGKDAFERQLRVMARFGTGFEAQVHRIAGHGPVVLTERTDVLEAGELRAAFWVCGTFEVHDGHITLWRDYFDWLTVTAAFLRGAPRAISGAVSRRLNRRHSAS